MITEKLISTIDSNSQLFSRFANELVDSFNNTNDFTLEQLENGILLNFNILDRETKKKINPILKLASVEDAQELVDICEEVYAGTYPYKEYTDVDAIRQKIKSSNYHFFLFKDVNGNSMGCFKYCLDFEQKRGYLGGFMVRRKYQGRVDVVKAMISMAVVMISKYGDEIMLWYCENRTAHVKSQYSFLKCGLRPIAFYPNKDIFFDNVESDLMQILYDKKVLNGSRCPKTPIIIPEAVDCFHFSDRVYNLGSMQISTPNIVLNPLKLASLTKNLTIKVNRDKYGYENISMSFTGSRSYFKFLYTPTVKNFEKAEYQVSSLEELFVFIQEYKKMARQKGVRYMEIFVSAYKPAHQRLFSDIGFVPRGYIPSWQYIEKVFEDHILFNLAEGEIDPNIQLIDEAGELLEILDLCN